ncbi:MAG: Kae1-associated kinase Bud32 [Desulfurococcus sp.]|nr:Kae1-associated kinase Bud32 [Desulfurococcus sp.]
MALKEAGFSWGAESIVFISNLLGRRVVVKKRVSKPYRHPLYDELFIKSRTRIEAKILAELYEAGLRVPAPVLVDVEGGVIVMEYIEGARTSEILGQASIEIVRRIAWDTGEQSAIMHNMGVYHGDLTLANLIYTSSGVYMIDFGLAGYSLDVEEYAIDIHLLRRSIASLYPSLLNDFMEAYLEAYRRRYKGDYEELERRLREIGVRGRYFDKSLRRSLKRERYID